MATVKKALSQSLLECGMGRTLCVSSIQLNRSKRVRQKSLKTAKIVHVSIQRVVRLANLKVVS